MMCIWTHEDAGSTMVINEINGVDQTSSNSSPYNLDLLNNRALAKGMNRSLLFLAIDNTIGQIGLTKLDEQPI